MTNLKDSYQTLCSNLKVPIDIQVVKAFSEVCTTGEFNIAGHSITTQTCEILSKVLSQCKDIFKLNLSDCLLPPQGLTSIFASISSTNIHNIQLKGNNIGGPCVMKLSKMISRCSNVKSLSLEWNNLGLCLEGMAQFCSSLADNHSLEVLDLRNNQLDEECAILLATALKKNDSLRVLDIRWNTVDQRGGQHFLDSLQTNKTLTTLKLQGNSISNDLLMAIEQSIQHNIKTLRLENGFEARKELLANHVRAVNARRSQELQEWAEKSRRQVSEMDARIKEMHEMVVEKQQQVERLERVLGERELQLREAEDQLKLQEQNHSAIVRDYQRQLDILNKALADNKNYLSNLEERFNEEVKLRKTIEIELAGEKEKVQKYEQVTNQVKKELQQTITHHIGAIEEERKQAEQRLMLVEEDWKGRLEQKVGEYSRAEQVYRERVKALESAVQAAEHSQAELNKQLLSERALWNQEKTAIWAEAAEKESYKIMILSEKVDSLKQEKNNMEVQLNMTNTTAQKLQQDNSIIVGELGEIRRKLSSVQEELSYERVTNEKLKSEKMEEQRLTESLRAEVTNNLRTIAKAEEEEERLKRDLRRLKEELDDKDRQISKSRREEKERAEVLVTAMKNYLDQVKTPISS